jgi:hypothetical protein
VHEYRFPAALDLPLEVSDSSQVPTDPYLYNAWGYFKGAATLELFRLHVGEAVFDDALNRYLRACDVGPCDTDVFRAKLEEASSRSLGPLFDEWIMKARRRPLSIAFAPVPGGVAITLDQGTAGPMPLELWLEGRDGSLQRERWELAAAHETRTVGTSMPVRAVRLNPRLEGIVRADSNVAGDVDFDGEVDGFDLIACSLLVGHSLTGASPELSGIWGFDLAFDRRCDRDHDGRITSADVAALPFNTLRSSP